jgi:hypothetical protein
MDTSLQKPAKGSIQFFNTADADGSVPPEIRYADPEFFDEGLSYPYGLAVLNSWWDQNRGLVVLLRELVENTMLDRHTFYQLRALSTSLDIGYLELHDLLEPSNDIWPKEAKQKPITSLRDELEGLHGRLAGIVRKVEVIHNHDRTVEQIVGEMQLHVVTCIKKLRDHLEIPIARTKEQDLAATEKRDEPEDPEGAA